MPSFWNEFELVEDREPAGVLDWKDFELVQEQEPETGLRPPETPEEKAAFARLAQQMMAAAEPVISMAPAIRSDAQVPAAPEQPEPWDPWAGRAFAGAEETGQPSLRRVVADPAIAALKGAMSLPEAAVGLVDVIPGVEGRVGKFLEFGGMGFQPQAAKEWLSKQQSPELQAERGELEKATGVAETVKVLLDNPALLVDMGVESLPLMLGPGRVGAAVAGKLLPSLGGTGAAILGAGAAEGFTTTGMMAEQLRQQSPEGRLTPKQAALSQSAGAATAIIGILGGKLAKRLEIDDVDTLLAGGSAATRKANAIAVLKKIIGSAIEEGSEEFGQSISEQAHQNIAEGKPWDEGIWESGVAGGMVGALMGLGGGVYGGAGPGEGPPSVRLPGDEDIAGARFRAPVAAGEVLEPPGGEMEGLGAPVPAAAAPARAPGVETTTTIDPRYVSEEREVPIKEIAINKDVPNFKAKADPNTGVIPEEKLEGKYERLGTARIVLWRKNNGELEVITGRHRLDLARRTGEKTIPAQIVDESKGFTLEMALIFDAEANIRDEKGSLDDYAEYFRNSTVLDEETATARGLLSSVKSRSGWDLGKNASDDLYAAWRSGKITDSRAVAIASAAPKDAARQQLGIKLALDGKHPEFIRARLERERAKTKSPVQTDMFGNPVWEDSKADAEAQNVADIRKDITERIRAAQNAAKNPKAAERMGINVRDPQAVIQEIARLKGELERWNGAWWLDAELGAKARGEAPKAPSSELSRNVAEAIRRYDDGEGIDTVSDLADELESLVAEGKAPESLLKAIQSYRAAIKEDMEEFGGRGDADAYEAEFLDAVKREAAVAKPAPKKPEEPAAVNQDIAEAIAVTNWKGTVREATFKGQKVFIPVDSSGKDVSVSGKIILGMSPKEAIELAQRNVKAPAAPKEAAPAAPQPVEPEGGAVMALTPGEKPRIANLGTGTRMNSLGDPLGTTYYASPEDWAQWSKIQDDYKAALAIKDYDAFYQAQKLAEPIKNKYGGNPPVAPAEGAAAQTGFRRIVQNPYSAKAVWDFLVSQGIKPYNRRVVIVSRPDVEWLAMFNPTSGLIEINRANIDNEDVLAWAWEHELGHAFDFSNPGQVLALRKRLTAEERKRIVREVRNSGYLRRDAKREVNARAVTLLADAWRKRSWFNRFAKSAEQWMADAGLTSGENPELARAMAERAAARAIAESTKEVAAERWRPTTRFSDSEARAFAARQAGPDRMPPPPNPPIASDGARPPSPEVIRANRDYTLFNRINTGQWIFYFGRLGEAAKAAWETMALGEFRMRESVRKDVREFVSNTLTSLPRKLRKKGGKALFEALDGRTMDEIRKEWSGQPGGEAVIGQASRVKGRLEEIRQTIRDIKHASFLRYLMEINKESLAELYQRNIGGEPGEMTKLKMAEGLAAQEFPPDWGIADGSYLPHIFFGQWKVTARLPGGEQAVFITRAQTIQEAKARIFQQVQGNPDMAQAQFAIEQDTVMPADMIRLGDRRFWMLVQKMREQNMEPNAVRDALQGNIGRKSGKQKWFGNLMKRKGFGGYSQDYARVMTAYLNGFHRWRILTAVNREVQPLLEQVRAEGRLNAEQRLQEILKNLWGAPSAATAQFDAFVRQAPWLRDLVKPMALDRWARAATHMAGTLTLRTVRFSVVNRLQPLQGLYPLVGEAGIVRAKIMQHTEAGRRLLEQSGVELDPGQYANELAASGMKRDIVERLSGERSNQEVAFLAMYNHARSLGVNHQDAIIYGKLRGQLMTQFTPLAVDTPELFEGPLGRLIFQFKRFPVKQIELISNMARDRNVPAIARLLLAYALLGGLSFFWRQFWLGRREEKLRLKRAMDTSIGTRAADTVMYGLPGFLGADISGSIALGDEPMGANVYEKLGRAFTGPAVSLGLEAGRTIGTTAREQVSPTQKAEVVLRRFPTTRPLAELSALLRSDYDLRTPDGEVKLRRNLKDVLVGLGSFRSANEANISLAVNGIMDLAKEEAALKNNFVTAEDKDKAWEKIEQFNARWPEAAITWENVERYMNYRAGAKQRTDAERVAKKRHYQLLPESQRLPQE